MRIGTAVTTGFRCDSNGLCALDPALRREGKVVATRLIFKPLEFERFKIRITQFLPKPEELDGAPATHPVVNDRKRLLCVPILGDVGQREIILLIPMQDSDGQALD